MNRKLQYFALIILGGVVSNVTAAEPSNFYQCARNPAFVRSAGMIPPVAIDTQQSLLPGVVVREMQGQKRMFRHPTWELSGNVGSTVRDEQGNIYAIPIPGVGLDTNPLEKRTNIYKIDSQSGEMTVFAKLPSDDNSSQRNPFGTMGIAYDCSAKKLLVSSVADSGPRTQRGGVFAIDVVSKEVTPLIQNRDVIGLDVFDPGTGKRLYFGDARSSSVYSAPLSADYQPIIADSYQHEFSLLELKSGNSTQIRKIRFVADEDVGFKLVATDTEFDFRLIANTSRRFRHYEFMYKQADKKWQFLKIR